MAVRQRSAVSFCSHESPRKTSGSGLGVVDRKSRQRLECARLQRRCSCSQREMLERGSAVGVIGRLPKAVLKTHAFQTLARQTLRVLTQLGSLHAVLWRFVESDSSWRQPPPQGRSLLDAGFWVSDGPIMNWLRTHSLLRVQRLRRRMRLNFHSSRCQAYENQTNCDSNLRAVCGTDAHGQQPSTTRDQD